jgi:hypothetical protein
MSETVSRLVYCGKRKLGKAKKAVPCFCDPDAPSLTNFTTFEKTLNVPYPVGTVIAFQRTEEGAWRMSWGQTANPEGLYHDAELVRAWELASRSEAAAEAKAKALAKQGGLIDKNVDAILDAIDRLPSFDRPAARAYVMGRLMGGSR